MKTFEIDIMTYHPYTNNPQPFSLRIKAPDIATIEALLGLGSYVVDIERVEGDDVDGEIKTSLYLSPTHGLGKMK